MDANYNTAYVYGQDGGRTNKYTSSSETLYFNKMWTLHTDSGNAVYGGQTAKNIYLGDTRIVTKLNSGTEPTYQEEYYKQYYYHSDHLGSASLITDYNGNEYQRIEYTPYGEIWVDKTENTGLEYLPYKFTGKEQDEETGLYYYGARYLDPKYSRWISTDPALKDYIPQAPVSDEARKHNQNLPGMGGVFNHINSDLYAYGANNPVRYIDPDGNSPLVFNAKDFFNILNIADEPNIKLYNEMKSADCGNMAAQSNLKYIFHEAGREMLAEISEKSGDVSLLFLVLGCPEGATVSGAVSMLADGMLAVDDLVNGNIFDGVSELILIGASYGASKSVEKTMAKVATIQIHIGETGRYYQVGHRGAIKTESALRKIVARDIASGYFGENIAPEIASQIVEKAADAFKAATNEE